MDWVSALVGALATVGVAALLMALRRFLGIGAGLPTNAQVEAAVRQARATGQEAKVVRAEARAAAKLEEGAEVKEVDKAMRDPDPQKALAFLFDIRDK